MKGSISLMRANPLLTTNVKLVVDTNYSLYLESYSANQELSTSKYKKYLINDKCFLSEKIASFYNGLPIDLAFEVKNNIKSDVIQENLINQIDDIYFSGAKNVEDKRYTEEFQYNTTLKIDPLNLPKYFFIFRHDGTGKENLTDYKKFIKDLKLVKVFNLTDETSLGRLFKKNYIDDDQIYNSPLELNFKEYEFSKWKGYDYYSGGSVNKSLFMTDFMQNEISDFELDKFLSEGFKNNGVINSNFLNISFLFDDTVGGIFNINNSYSLNDYPTIQKMIIDGEIDPDVYDTNTGIFDEHTTYRKRWTINRYSGFYLNDLNFHNKITSYETVPFILDQGIQIVNNVFKSSGGDNINPILRVINNDIPFYFKIANTFYRVEKNPIYDTNNSLIDTEYLLISDQIFNGSLLDFYNNSEKTIKIEYKKDDTTSLPDEYRSYITYLKGGDYQDSSLDYYFDNGIVVIKMFDNFYKLSKDSKDRIYINTDELITSDSYTYMSKLANNEAKKVSMQVLKKDQNVNYFEIYILKFTDIKDWDFNRTDTKYANIEYDKNNEISYERPFLYKKDVKDVNLPQDIYLEKRYNIHYAGLSITNNSKSFILPQSSEYACTGDLYVIDELSNLTKIWDINQSINKWGILNSLNTNDYPYKINNSLSVSNVFNYTPNLYEANPNITDLNLDYFFTLGEPAESDLIDINYTKFTNIIHRTLNIDLPKLGIGTGNTIYDNYIFDIEYYKNKNASFDYFNYIFNLYTDYNINNNQTLINQQKYAILQDGDDVNGPYVFFKGFAAYIKYVDMSNPNIVSRYTSTPATDLNNYKFSILFSCRYTDDLALHGKSGIEVILNKIYKNILINIFIYTPSGSISSLDYRTRDKVYDEKSIEYTVNFDNSSTIDYWKTSNLKTSALTLNNIVQTLNSNQLETEDFDKIKYTVIENLTEYKINGISINSDELTLKFIDDIEFKEGDWIYLQNSSYVDLNKNLQVIKKENNKKLVVKIINNGFSPITLNADLNNIIITKEQSILPFRLQIVEPDEIKINSNVNQIIDSDKLNITPVNNFKTVPILNIELNNKDGLIPYVYTDESKSRQIIKNNSNEQITYEELNKLPSIFRYSSLYEPILNNVDLFNKCKLIPFNNKLRNDINSYLLSITLNSNNNIEFTYTGVIKDFKINNIIYFGYVDKSLLGVDPNMQYRTSHIIDIQYTLTQTIITIDLKSNTISNNIGDYNLFYFTRIEQNTTFEYDFDKFGILESLHIAKVYDNINPMQTNNDVYKTKNIYPIFDEHGITLINKNLFKSSWDDIFYFKTEPNKYK